jgi:DNA replication protein DnaC
MNGFEHVQPALHEQVRRLRDATAATRGPAPDVCADCRGTGWVVHNEHGTDRAHRCECWRRETTRKLKQKAEIPRRYAKCSFDSFRLYPNEELGRAFRRTRDFARTFPAPQASLLLAGPGGVGKTHLAVAILQECAEKGISGVFCDTAELLAKLRETYDRDSESRDTGILRRLSTVDLLVLDDMGSEELTQWGRSMLNVLLTTRYNQDRATICTTRQSPHLDEKESLAHAIGGRPFRILHQMCDIIEFDGADYHRAGDQPENHTLLRLWKERRELANAPAPRTHFSYSSGDQRAAPA